MWRRSTQQHSPVHYGSNLPSLFTRINLRFFGKNLGTEREIQQAINAAEANRKFADKPFRRTLKIFTCLQFKHMAMAIRP